jgi:SPP1 family predicted phage head-tail adaptor
MFKPVVLKGTRAGKLRQELEIQTCRETPDAAGQPVLEWVTDMSGHVRGRIEPLTGTELFYAQQVQPQVSHKITIRFVEGLTTKKRIRVKNTNRVFGILSATNVDELDTWISVMAKEAV